MLLGRIIKNRGGFGLFFAEDDDFLAAYGMLFAVADGIGGASAGAVASRLALTAFDAQFYSHQKGADMSAAVVTALEAAGDRANKTIQYVAENRPGCAGMGCTIAGVCLMPHGYVIFHAGDSRVYRFRNGFAKQLTSDDSVVNLAVQAGCMTVQEAEHSDTRHTITNSLGGGSFELHVEVGADLHDGDLLLACSDGLHDAVTHEDLEACAASAVLVQDKVDAWVRKAIEAGGHDNISALAILCLHDTLNPKP